jgi:hypothetical protein
MLPQLSFWRYSLLGHRIALGFIIMSFDDGGVVVLLFAGSAAKDAGEKPKHSRGNTTFSSNT